MGKQEKSSPKPWERARNFRRVGLKLALGLEISAQNLARSARFRAEISWKSKKTTPKVQRAAKAARWQFVCVFLAFGDERLKQGRSPCFKR